MTPPADLSWFRGARFGIFIHWGIYAVSGKDASWSFFNYELPWAKPEHHISKPDYMAQAKQFTAAKYDPAAWADLFARAGARYAVLTTKHCDDFCLWPSKDWSFNAAQAAPAGRDLVGPFAKALREKGLRVGLYYSHAGWGHPDYPTVFHEDKPIPEGDYINPNAYPPNRREDPAAWKRYVAFRDGQVKELCDNYSPDLLWFDADWERSSGQWQMAEFVDKVRAWRPGVVLNNRNHGLGDYRTPEQGQPLETPEGTWEYCVTMDWQWGYTEIDNDYKPLPHLVRLLVETASMGGNLLLNASPRADGTFPQEQLDRLEGLGAWLKPVGEAIYDTVAGLPNGYCYGPTTLSEDRKTLYVFLFDRPWKDFAVRGLRNKVKRVTHLASGTELKHLVRGGATWMNLPGTLWIDVPEELCHPLGTVLKLELDGPLDLYRGAGEVVTQN